MVSYLKAFVMCLILLVLAACSGTTSEVLPQATIPLPQSEDGDTDTIYLSVSTPDDEGYVGITSSDDLVPVDVNVVVKVLFEDEIVDEIDSGDVDETDDDVCEDISGLPVCPDLNDSNKCQTNPDDYGALSTKVPARVSDFIVVEYGVAGACDITNLAEIQVDETKVSQEFKKDDSGTYAKSGEATGGSNSTEDSYQKSSEYVVDVYVEKVAEDKSKTDTASTEQTDENTSTGDIKKNAEQIKELKDELKEKVTVVSSTEQIDTKSTDTKVAEQEPKKETEEVMPAEKPEKKLPTLPGNSNYFKKFVLDNFSDQFFSQTYGINKKRVHVVPLLKLINDELIAVVGVKQPGTPLLAYYVITADFVYDEGNAKFDYAFTDYEFIIKSMAAFFKADHLVHDDQNQVGDFLSFRCNISRSINILDIKTLTIVKTKFW